MDRAGKFKRWLSYVRPGSHGSRSARLCTVLILIWTAVPIGLIILGETSTTPMSIKIDGEKLNEGRINGGVEEGEADMMDDGEADAEGDTEVSTESRMQR